jgi:hypothetical protein
MFKQEHAMANHEVLFNKIVSTTCEGKIGNEKNTYQRSTSLNLLLVTCQNVTFGNVFFHWEWVWCCVFFAVPVPKSIAFGGFPCRENFKMYSKNFKV